MANDKFRRDFADIVAKTKVKADTLVRKTALDLYSSLVLKSPVDSGQFRANWRASIGRVDTTIDATQDRDGSLSVGRGAAVINTMRAGDKIALTNSLPYARRLEYGWSQQAPSGMVRITVAEYRSYIEKIAAGLR